MSFIFAELINVFNVCMIRFAVKLIKDPINLFWLFFGIRQFEGSQELMTQWNFKGNYLLCISFLSVADCFIYKLSKFAKSHSSLNILIVQMSDI